MILEGFSGAEIEAPLLAEDFVLGGQFALNKFLGVLLVHRSKQVPLDPGGRDAGRRRWSPSDRRRTERRYLRQYHRVIHLGTHDCKRKILVYFSRASKYFSAGARTTKLVFIFRFVSILPIL